MLQKLIQQATPFLPEKVGSSQAAISTNHTQVSDPALHQVVSSFQASFMGTKLFTASAANDCTTLRQDHRDKTNLLNQLGK